MAQLGLLNGAKNTYVPLTISHDWLSGATAETCTTDDAIDTIDTFSKTSPAYTCAHVYAYNSFNIPSNVSNVSNDDQNNNQGCDTFKPRLTRQQSGSLKASKSWFEGFKVGVGVNCEGRLTIDY